MFHYANGGFDSDNIKSQSHLLLKCIGEHVREKGLSKVGNLWQRPQMLSMTFLVPGLVEAKDVFLKNLPVSHRMWVNSQRWVTHSYSRSLRRPEIIRLWTCNSPTPRLASESGRLIYRANFRFHSFPPSECGTQTALQEVGENPGLLGISEEHGWTNKSSLTFSSIPLKNKT